MIRQRVEAVPVPAPRDELPPEARIALDIEHLTDLLEQLLADEDLADAVPELGRRHLVNAARSVACASMLTEALADGLLTEPAQVRGADPESGA